MRRVAPEAPPDPALEVAACRRMIAQQATGALTADEQAALDRLCVLEASGSAAQAAATRRQICMIVVRRSGVVGAAAAAAEQSCPPA